MFQFRFHQYFKDNITQSKQIIKQTDKWFFDIFNRRCYIYFANYFRLIYWTNTMI